MSWASCTSRGISSAGAMPAEPTTAAQAKVVSSVRRFIGSPVVVIVHSLSYYEATSIVASGGVALVIRECARDVANAYIRLCGQCQHANCSSIEIDGRDASEAASVAANGRGIGDCPESPA